MGYYMRYLIAEDTGISLSQIEQRLKQVDPSYSITDDGALRFGDDLYGAVSLTFPDDSLFGEELEELKEEVEEATGKNKKKVIEVLDGAKAIVAVQVLYQGREIEETMEKLDPLWEWLFNNYKGLLQADEEGYYERG